MANLNAVTVNTKHYQCMIRIISAVHITAEYLRGFFPAFAGWDGGRPIPDGSHRNILATGREWQFGLHATIGRWAA